MAQQWPLEHVQLYHGQATMRKHSTELLSSSNNKNRMQLGKIGYNWLYLLLPYKLFQINTPNDDDTPVSPDSQTWSLEALARTLKH